jgi:DNA-binding SARP family transcriptional activator
VTSGDSLWKIAEEHLGDGDRFDEIFDLNAGRVQPDGGALTEPSRIEPGWVLDLPVESHAAPELPLEHPTPLPQQPAEIRRVDPTPVDTTSVTPPPQRVAAPDASETSDGAVDGALGIAGGFLAVGLAGAVRVRRQRQRMRRTPGMELPATPVASAPVVAALVDADLDVSREVVRLVRQLGSALVAAPHVPVPVVVSVHDNHVEVLMDHAEAGAPSPWTSDAGGRIWRANLSSGQSDLEEGPPWTPTMTSVGTLDADGLLLNLEAFGSVGLVGDGPSTCGLARSLAVELTSTPFADVPAVHVVADVIGELPDLAGLATHPDLASALAAAEAHTEGIRAALQRSTMDTLAEARCRVPAEAWAPAVVVVSASVGEVALRPLVERASERSGVVAVVVGGCPVGATEVQVSDDELFVPDLGLRCRPQQLSGASLTGITTLLDVYGADPEPPIDDADLALFEAVHVAEPDDEVKLRVNVLGPVTVTGAELSPQQVALVAYLALHNGATADAVRDAVWGGKAPTRERFLNTIHELRRAVGADVLPASVDGRYRLHHVWSDVAELEVLLGEADAVDVSGAGSNLRRVLELVEGPPLVHEGRHRRHFRWVDLGNHASRLERIIGDAAHELAERSLDAGDVDLARWAAQRGLLACPGSEVLTADLVRTHLAAGNRTAAQSVVDEFARVLEDLGDDEPPEALYSLLETRRAS